MTMPFSDPLYQIKDLARGDEFSCRIEFNPDHPILEGHFPGNPVVPGAWLIRCVHDALEMATGKRLRMNSASQIKFLNPVLASQELEVILQGKVTGEEDYLNVIATLLVPEKVFMKFRGQFSVV